MDISGGSKETTIINCSEYEDKKGLILESKSLGVHLIGVDIVQCMTFLKASGDLATLK